MVDNYSIKDVTRDLGFLLSLTKLFEVDNENFWYDPGDKQRYLHKLDANDLGKEIAIFQDPLPKGDVYLFNPFAEGFGRKSPVVQLFYRAIRIALNLNLRTAVRHVAQSVLDSKKAMESGAEYSISHVVVRMSSIVIEKRSTLYDVVDDKMVDEFELLFDRMKDECLFVPYLTNQQTAKVTIEALTDPKWDEKFGTEIRKKSLNAFKAAVMGVLGINKPDELQVFTVKYDPDLKSSAKFHTTMLVYLKLYSRFNDVLADAFAVDGNPSARDEINLDELTAVIDRFPLAYAIAKHMIQPVLPKSHPTDIRSTDTGALKLDGVTSSIGSAFTTRRFPGPEVIDDMGRKGRQGASLTFGRREEPTRRFAPHVISDAPVDPFAPAVRSSNNGSFASSGMSFGGGGGGYFGGSSSSPFASGGGGLNFTAPSNFGSPGTSRTYF